MTKKQADSIAACLFIPMLTDYLFPFWVVQLNRCNQKLSENWRISCYNPNLCVSLCVNCTVSIEKIPTYINLYSVSDSDTLEKLPSGRKAPCSADKIAQLYSSICRVAATRLWLILGSEKAIYNVADRSIRENMHKPPRPADLWMDAQLRREREEMRKIIMIKVILGFWGVVHSKLL